MAHRLLSMNGHVGVSANTHVTSVDACILEADIRWIANEAGGWAKDTGPRGGTFSYC